MNSLSVKIELTDGAWFLVWSGDPDVLVSGGEYCVQQFDTFDLTVEKAKQLLLGKKDG